jgi:ABC-2 type transport system ATP-binding protein
MSYFVHDITVRFGATVALDHVSFDIEPGRIHAVIGGDGAGKSTLLEVMAGLDVGQTGTATLPTSGRISYVPSRGGVFADLTVDENMEFVADAYRLRNWSARATELLERAGIAWLGGRLAGRMSGGERRKLAGCLALLPRPELIVLDEVTTGVDPVSRMELWRLLADAAADGAAVVAATTYVDEAERMEHVVLLHDGRELASGAPTAIIDGVPGAVYAVEQPTAPIAAWRAGRAWRQWSRTSLPGHAPVTLSLDDAAIVLELDADTACPRQRSTPVIPADHTGAHPRRPDTASHSASIATARPASIATARHVTRTFGTVTAVEDMDLDVAPGEIVGLLGANGAGKTTLIKMLLGLLTPTAGTITLFGRPHSRQLRRRIGYVPQHLGLYGDLTSLENLQFRAEVFGMERHDLHPNSDLDLDLGSGDDDGRTPIADQPLGRQRWTAFAAATQHRPELLVLDEPTSGVSPLSRSRLWDLIHAHADRGVGVLVSTHYMDEAEQADRLVVMSQGVLVAAGTASEVVGGRTAVSVTSERWGDAFVALDRPARHLRLAGRTVRVLGASIEQISAELADAGIAASLDSVPATLEEVLVEMDSPRLAATTGAARRTTP